MIATEFEYLKDRETWMLSVWMRGMSNLKPVERAMLKGGWKRSKNSYHEWVT